MPISSHPRAPGLDLIRAIAVLLVLLCHWSGHFGYWFHLTVPAALELTGNTGVDLFFALSGFLIGRILIGIVDARPNWRDFRVFLARRAMRTLPLYFVWLLVLLAMFPPRQDGLTTALRFATLTQNLFAPMPPDYYFAVTWSLTIEEWFYLLFGGMLIGLARRIGGQRALTICLATFMVGPLTARLIDDQTGGLVYGRIDEIAYGVLMARLYLRRSRLFDHPLASLAAGLALHGAVASGAMPVALIPAAAAAGGALLLPAALRLRPGYGWFAVAVRWIASRSYALYVVHLTILSDVAEHLLWEFGLLPAPACVVVAVAGPFLVAEISYRYLEVPLLRRRPRQAPLMAGGQTVVIL